MKWLRDGRYLEVLCIAQFWAYMPNLYYPVEWVEIRNHFENDLALAEHFKAHNLVMLPGRQFYWSKTGSFAQSGSARFALLKPKSEFLSALDVVKRELRRLSL